MEIITRAILLVTMTIFIVTGLLLLLINNYTDFTCIVVPLESYGMEGAEGERICTNPDDETDFIIVTGYAIGDKLTILKGWAK